MTVKESGPIFRSKDLYSSMKELSRRDVMILLLLVKFGELSKYEMFKKAETQSKKLNLGDAPSYSSFHSGVQKLMNHKLIKVSKTLPSEKNKEIDVDYYKLTFDGILMLIMIDYSYRDYVQITGKDLSDSDYSFQWLPTIADGLLEHYPDYLPEEFHKFSSRFKKWVVIDFLINYGSTIQWSSLMISQTFYSGGKSHIDKYVSWLKAKINNKTVPENDIFVKDMTDNDVIVLGELIQKLLRNSIKFHKDGLVKSLGRVEEVNQELRKHNPSYEGKEYLKPEDIIPELKKKE